MLRCYIIPFWRFERQIAEGVFERVVSLGEKAERHYHDVYGDEDIEDEAETTSTRRTKRLSFFV